MDLWGNRTILRTHQPGAAAAGTALILGEVVGGCVKPDNPTADAEDWVYSSYKPYGFPLELDSEAKLVPDVYDWSEFTLPEEFKTGDSIDNVLPNGLCYVKLVRPYSFGSKSWDSGLVLSPPLATANVVPEFEKAVTEEGNHSVIRLYFNRELQASPDLGAAFLSIALTSSEANPDELFISGVSVSSDSLYLAVQLSRALDPDTETLKISGVSALAFSKDSPPLPTSAFSGKSVTYAGEKYAIQICLNRNGLQSFTRGDLVLISEETVSITDEQGVTEAVPEILLAATAAQTHNHLHWGGGGQGPAYLNPVSPTGGG
jgi:hypothetical protein